MMDGDFTLDFWIFPISYPGTWGSLVVLWGLQSEPTQRPFLEFGRREMALQSLLLFRRNNRCPRAVDVAPRCCHPFRADLSCLR